MSNNNFYKYNFLTNKAFEFQSLIMSGKQMTFTKVEIGDGLVGDEENLQDISFLKNKITDVKILSVVPKGHTVELTILLDGDGLDEVTLYREIGIYATIDDNEVLYAYLNSDDKFDYIIPLNEGNQREFTNNKIKISLVVGNSDNINVEINNTTIPDNTITMDMLTIEVKDYIGDIKSKVDRVENDFNNHINFNVTGDDGSHGIKYDKSTNTLKYKDGESWETIPTGQRAEEQINGHKEESILSENGAHDIRYDKDNNVFKYRESEDWHDIDTGAGAKEEIGVHQNKKISDSDGVHGIEFIEELDTLKITKQNGQVANFKPGLDPDLLMSDLVNGLDECMEKVGKSNE